MKYLALLAILGLSGCSWSSYEHVNADKSYERVVLFRNLFDAKYGSAAATLPSGTKFEVTNFEGQPDQQALQVLGAAISKLPTPK